jgi:hypothetical protein
MAAFGRVEIKSSKGLLDPPLQVEVSSSADLCRRPRHIDCLLLVALFEAVGSEIECLRGASTSPGQASQRDVVQINRAQSRRSRASDVGGGLENIELRSESGSEV